MRKFGRLAPDLKLLARLPKAAPHLDALIPPPSADWSKSVAPNSWGVMLNETIGDCTCAAIGHYWVMVETYCPPRSDPTDRAVEAMYSAVSGYVPGDPDTDAGAGLADVLAYATRTGLQCGDEMMKLSAWPMVDVSNHDHVRAAIWAFGAVDIGVVVRQANLDETDAGSPWSSLDGPVVGGHSVLVVGYDDAGLTCVTWGQLQRLTWDWWDGACEEAYAPVSQRWTASGNTPAGIPVSVLEAEAAALDT